MLPSISLSPSSRQVCRCYLHAIPLWVPRTSRRTASLSAAGDSNFQRPRRASYIMIERSLLYLCPPFRWIVVVGRILLIQGGSWNPSYIQRGLNFVVQAKSKEGTFYDSKEEKTKIENSKITLKILWIGGKLVKYIYTNIRNFQLNSWNFFLA